MKTVLWVEGGIEREQREWGAHDWLRLKLIKERKRRNGAQTILIIQTSPFSLIRFMQTKLISWERLAPVVGGVI